MDVESLPELEAKLSLYLEQVQQIDSALESTSAETESQADDLKNLREQLLELIKITEDLITFQRENSAASQSEVQKDVESPQGEEGNLQDAATEDANEDIEVEIFPVGSKVLAEWHDGSWREGIVNAWEITEDSSDIRYRITFTHSKLQLELGLDSVQPHPDPLPEDETAGSSSSSEDEAEEDEDAARPGLGGRASPKREDGMWAEERTGPALFEWDHRGVASKLMASMGYKSGMGLGRNESGRVDALKAHAPVPKTTSLDAFSAAKKRSRPVQTTGKASLMVGVERWERGKRRIVLRNAKADPVEKKAKGDTTGEAARPADDMFDFLNAKLNVKAGGSGGSGRTAGSAKTQSSEAQKMSKDELRKTIFANREEQDKLRKRIGEIEQSVARAKKHRDRVMEAKFASHKLNLQKQLADVIREEARLEDKVKEKADRRNTKANKFEF